MTGISPTVQQWIDDARKDPEAFWHRAAEQLPWFRKWDQVLDWTFPTFRWFVGGRTNLAYNALDHHVLQGHGGRTALIHVDERGQHRSYTYAELLVEVQRLASALRSMGIGRGDRLTIYMPTCPEAIMLMLATVRIGAIHSVVFAGFGARALSDRVKASGSRLIFSADITYRKGKDVPLKGIVDDALQMGCDCVERSIVLRRSQDDENAQHQDQHQNQNDDTSAPGGRDMTWREFVARGTSDPVPCEEMEANEPAFILATSGTTAKPKLAVHTHGGYQVHIHSMGQWCFALNPNDVWWSTSDIGWIVGHSYIVYAPLIAGCATVTFEGAIDYPDPATVWRIVEKLQVTGMFTSPTAVRLLMRYGEQPARGFNLSSLQRIFCAGEVLNAPAWEWLQKAVLEDRVPVIDHMWQTETGGPVFGNPLGIEMLPIKAGSSTIPLPGIEAAVVDGATGEPCRANEKGIMVIRRPFPGLTPALWGEPERYEQDYWRRIPGVYSTGDSAQIDDDGYVWFAGRSDEIIKIAAHRVGTIEVETAILQHPMVAEAGVTGRPDELRGEVISAFVVLKQGNEPSEPLRRQILDVVRRELGPVAVIGELNFVSSLPKTRSGKIMRRVLKAVTLDRPPGDITTIDDESSVDDARRAWHEMKDDIAAQYKWSSEL